MLKMAKNGPLEAEMRPKEAQTAQNGPKCPQNDPKPRKKVPLRKATLSPCVWAPASQLAPVGGHKTAKNGQKWAKTVPKGPKRPQNDPKPRTKVCLCKATLSPWLSSEVEGLVRRLWRWHWLWRWHGGWCWWLVRDLVELLLCLHPHVVTGLGLHAVGHVDRQ